LEQGFVNVKGGKLYYEVEGNGAPLVLIHAGFLDSRMWDEQFRIFAKHNKVIRYDVRGFGRSSRPKEEYSDAEDLFSLLNHLKIPKATILGISNGGRIAFDFTSTHPDMVTSLLLVAPGIRGYEGSPEEDKAWDETGKLMDAQDLAIKENRIDDAVRMDLEIWAPAQDEKNRTRLLQIATENSHIHKDPPNRLQKSPQPPAFKSLGTIRMPVALLVGDRDVRGMQMMTKKLHSLLPGSKFTVVEGADHIANTSKPDEFNRAVLDFLSST